MLMLMKYEMRKTMMARILFAVIFLIVEGFYLKGLFKSSDEQVVIGVMLLVTVSMFGIFCLGLQGIIMLHKDLNSKQSYMLFLTPHSSAAILGAKMLENAFAIIVAGLLCGGVMYADFLMALNKYGSVVELMKMAAAVMNVDIQFSITTMDVVAVAASAAASWILMVVLGYMAVILTATVLAGRKFSAVVAFVLYIFLFWCYGKVIEFLPSMSTMQMDMTLQAGVTLLISAVVYVICSLIMEKKLSV